MALSKKAGSKKTSPTSSADAWNTGLMRLACAVREGTLFKRGPIRQPDPLLRSIGAGHERARQLRANGAAPK